ncbi:MAG: hypothetical protein AAFZ18_27700 [Myxococcota bacterium]
MAERKFHCDGCGAHVAFSPEAQRLVCPYCGTEKARPESEAEVVEHDLGGALEKGFAEAPTVEAQTLRCGACGATTRIEGHVLASRCPFCDTPFTAPPTAERVLLPQATLPFRVEARDAREAFSKWMAGRWFAPNDLLRRARKEGLDGVYLPFFTFDATTETWYRGERGDHYYETESYTAYENGEAVRRSRTVQRTRWWPTSGAVFLGFDDVLVLASQGLPESLVRKLEPWDLDALVPHDESFLSGFTAEIDQRGLKDGFAECKTRCEPEIQRQVRRDIGGDVQRIHHHNTAWSGVTFKHVLLPVWVGAFRYRDAVYRVVVNARTGEVQGERPWSWWKIGATVLAAAVLIAVLYALFGDELG